MNNGAKIIVKNGTSSNPIFVVLNTPTASPIITSSTSDGIILEGEYNRFQYNLSTTTTAITMPLMSNNLESFPLSLTPTIAGVGSGNIRFSTVAASTRSTGWDNFLYKPSDVTNMNSTTGTANSQSTIDRFWIIDANGYTTKPKVTLSFTYIDAEWATNGGNSITESDLGAQRFNSSINSWQGLVYTPTGTINTTTNQVSNVVVNSSDFYRTWTLNLRAIPLPISLLYFGGECLNSNRLNLKWSTANETNNDFFTIESSDDGSNWYEVSQVNSLGNNMTTQNYSCVVSGDETMTSYYRLKQTDIDGIYSYSDIIFPNCIETGYTIFQNEIENIIIKFPPSGAKKIEIEIEIYNSIGQLVYNTFVCIDGDQSTKNISIANLIPGMYLFHLKDDKDNIVTKKILKI